MNPMHRWTISSLVPPTRRGRLAWVGASSSRPVVFAAPAIVCASTHPSGVPRAAFAKALATDRIALSDDVFREIAEAPHHPKLAGFINADSREELLQSLYAACAMV